MRASLSPALRAAPRPRPPYRASVLTCRAELVRPPPRRPTQDSDSGGRGDGGRGRGGGRGGGGRGRAPEGGRRMSLDEARGWLNELFADPRLKLTNAAGKDPSCGLPLPPLRPGAAGREIPLLVNRFPVQTGNAEVLQYLVTFPDRQAQSGGGGSSGAAKGAGAEAERGRPQIGLDERRPPPAGLGGAARAAAGVAARLLGV
ncbi:hypothetical protein MNEG_12313 [Monoraphidium neglectum]|uniref:Uncharacterized protein n=1 Tax=Monoraphidium neglectum TaxID=145388 RepID=A0A0D2KIR0_9CHLO|nr:hypothetical protein MNEG_12313 [Monoraphidium neglectum]KIY95648.1 hypothetical protein MNEG_12313 [Monoraphidium neglectum]|eukprot:XP_013894668.1 hypothetical protein MNEG_12313 [Monoraphidium neglectum]